MIKIEKIQISSGSYPYKTSDRINAESKHTLESDAVEFDGEKASEKQQEEQPKEQEEHEEQLAQEHPAPKSSAPNSKTLDIVA